MVDDWIVYREPVKIKNSKGFFAVAKVETIVKDPDVSDRYRAIIEDGSYLPFSPTVPHKIDGEAVERDLANAQAAVRPLSPSDFARIIRLGLQENDILPRVDDATTDDRLREEATPYEFERPIVQSLVSRPFRDRAFRRAVLDAYEERCAITGWKLINGGGRAEAEAAHIRPVEHGGPDSVRNGLALSGTAHWMFDRGLISLSDDLDVLISYQVNDRSSLDAIINPSRKARTPSDPTQRPHPTYLRWHRENCFKG